MASNHVAIVGAGHAGGTVAALLRQKGFAGQITLLGNEGEIPYQRPPLSKAWLDGKMSSDELALRPSHFYVEQRIELRISDAVHRINTEDKVLFLTSGEILGFDQLIIATGARPRRLENGYSVSEGLLYLRDLCDASKLSNHLRRASRLIILGAGYIGLEVAAKARQMGVDVMVLERESSILARVASKPIADRVMALHEDAGVRFRLGVSLSSIHENEGVFTSLTLADNETFDADLLLVGIGAVPNDEIARTAGIACDQGIIVDEACCTSHPAIYAIGDVTRQRLPDGGFLPRNESISNALDQARRASCAIAGYPVPPPEVPWFWSDQYATKLQMVGSRSSQDNVEILQTAIGEGLVVRHEKMGRLVALEAVNSPREFMLAKRELSKNFAI